MTTTKTEWLVQWRRDGISDDWMSYIPFSKLKTLDDAKAEFEAIKAENPKDETRLIERTTTTAERVIE